MPNARAGPGVTSTLPDRARQVLKSGGPRAAHFDQPRSAAREEPERIVADNAAQHPVDPRAQPRQFDCDADFVGLVEGHEDEQVEHGESLLDPREQPAGRLPCAAARHLQIAQEVERAAIEDHIRLAGEPKDRCDARVELPLVILDRWWVCELNALLDERPVGFILARIAGMVRDEVVDQGALAAPMRAGHRDPHGCTPVSKPVPDASPPSRKPMDATFDTASMLFPR